MKHLDGLIIEVGCWEGKSTTHLARAVFPEILICNDTWKGNVEESKVTGVKNISETIAESRDVYSFFLGNMKQLTQGNFTVEKKDCMIFLKGLADDTKIKFCHVDASHDYESVKETIELANKHLVDGGILCGDDYRTANRNRRDLHGGVQRAVQEVFPVHKVIGNLWYYCKED
uniref:Methyltransferase domain protein n=1 Tax=Pithovirus LCPAC404 TaxID=2506597 RepID=A0A481ZD39_9VIRU|nr:MAG: methyltransferase domain protein [Pithovirus LCPAC404]